MDRPPELDIDFWEDPVIEQEPLEFDIHCPRIKPKQKGGRRLNWTKEQCRIRAEMNAPCIKKCEFGRKMKTALDKNGR